MNNKLLNNLKPKSEFTKNVLTLMTGTTIAQAIPVAISPILTRLYTPEDFGVFALFMAIVSIFGSIANGSYEYAIMLPKKDEDAINIFALGFIINIILTLLLFLVILIFHDNIISLLDNYEISLWLYFIPFIVFLMGLYNLLNYFNNRLKNYKDLAKANVYKSIAGAIVQLSIGLLKTGALGLISGYIVSQIVSNTKLFFNIKKLNLFSIIKIRKIIFVAKRYKNFPKYTLLNNIVDLLRGHGFNILINSIYYSATLGQYYLAQRMLKLPFSIIGSSISQVFLQKVSTSDKHELFNLSLKFIKKVSILVLPIFIFIYLFGADIFIIIFGNKWQMAGNIVSILSFWVFLSFITSPLSNIFIVLEKQHIVLIYAIIYATVPIILIILIKNNFIKMIEYLSLSMTIVLLIFIIQIFYTLNLERKKNVI